MRRSLLDLGWAALFALVCLLCNVPKAYAQAAGPWEGFTECAGSDGPCNAPVGSVVRYGVPGTPYWYEALVPSRGFVTCAGVQDPVPAGSTAVVIGSDHPVTHTDPPNAYYALRCGYRSQGSGGSDPEFDESLPLRGDDALQLAWMVVGCWAAAWGVKHIGRALFR